MTVELRLVDLGEHRIIEELLAPRYASDDFGDDCAVVGVPVGAEVVASTDPCPEPAVFGLGFEDLFHMGWLAATINLSDLAAAGATPLGLVVSYDLPETMVVSDLERLLDGVDAACAASGCRVLGGNIRDAAATAVVATAIGACEGSRLSRKAFLPGQKILAIGDLGAFWAAALTRMRGMALAADDASWLTERLLAPAAKTASAAALARDGLVTGAIDASDGLAATLHQISRSSQVTVTVDVDGWGCSGPVARAAAALGVHPGRLALGFGDWLLVVSAAPDEVDEVVTSCAGVGHVATVLGDITAGPAEVRATFDGRAGVLCGLRNERFTPSSWGLRRLDGIAAQIAEGPVLAGA